MSARNAAAEVAAKTSPKDDEARTPGQAVWALVNELYILRALVRERPLEGYLVIGDVQGTFERLVSLAEETLDEVEFWVRERGGAQ